jgi:hypothetical protein
MSAWFGEMLFGGLAVVLFLTLVVRLRRGLIRLLQALLFLTQAAAVGSSALFYLYPDWLPAELSARLPAESSGALWPVLAGGVIVFGLPLLAILDFARRLDAVTLCVESIRHDLRQVAGRGGEAPRQSRQTSSAPNNVAHATRAPIESEPDRPKQRLGDILFPRASS